MALTHIEHPEDLVLTGNLWVIDALFENADISVKIDGAPAIVWGTHPDTGKFFVGTKSVFNKKKIKIATNLKEIREHYGHSDDLVDILWVCLRNLPRTKGVYQGDFIGTGGQITYTPNTLTYMFPKTVEQRIIVAPHTHYEVFKGKPLYEAIPHPLKVELVSNKKCLFVQPSVDRVLPKEMAPSISYDDYEFMTEKEAAQAKMSINALIREGVEINDSVLSDILGDTRLANLWQLVKEMKEELMETFIVYGHPQTFVGGERTNPEGFVLYSDLGPIPLKLVNREVFAYNNMNHGRFA